jgi:hypothetical protein
VLAGLRGARQARSSSADRIPFARGQALKIRKNFVLTASPGKRRRRRSLRYCHRFRRRQMTEEPRMHRLAIILLTVVVLPLLATRPSEAQYAAQLYPYCSLSASNGATSCYIGSRAECGRNVCISNPWYVGRERARPYLEGRRPLGPRYVRP